MIDSQTYTATLISTQPNNHCELCSFFFPITAGDNFNSYWEPPKLGTKENENCGGYVKCPSCNRTCVKFFVAEGDEHPLRVPDDFITRQPCHSLKEANALFVPKIPRSAWHEEYWNSLRSKHNPNELCSWSDRPSSSEKRKPVKPTVPTQRTLIPAIKLKGGSKTKRKVRFTGLE